MADPQRRLADAYAAVRAVGLEAMETEASASTAVRQAHATLAAANAAAKSAADARRTARRSILALGTVLDILDTDEGIAT